MLIWMTIHCENIIKKSLQLETGERKKSVEENKTPINRLANVTKIKKITVFFDFVNITNLVYSLGSSK